MLLPGKFPEPDTRRELGVVRLHIEPGGGGNHTSPLLVEMLFTLENSLSR